MSLVDSLAERSTTRVRDLFGVTKKPRDLNIAALASVPFAPMDAIPQDGSFDARFEMRDTGRLTSGTYFEARDVLISKITPCFENGKQALGSNVPGGFGYATTEVIPLHPSVLGTDVRLLFYYLLHPDVRAFITSRMEGSTARKRVPDEVLLDLPYPEFGTNDQQTIANALALVREAIHVETASAATASALKRAAMRGLLTRGLRGEERHETSFGFVPVSWRVTTLREVADLERGRFLHRPRNEPRFYNGSVPFVQTGDVVRSKGRIREFTQTLNDAGVAISRVFPKGTILITIAANIGYTGILEMDAACPDSLIAVRPKGDLDVRFLEYFLQTQQTEMDRLAPKGTQKNINIQFLEPWPVAIPIDLSEQREIVEILDAIDQKIDLHRRKKAVLEELFKTLLHKLMTGEIRVSDLDLSALDDAPTEKSA